MSWAFRAATCRQVLAIATMLAQAMLGLQLARTEEPGPRLAMVPDRSRGDQQAMSRTTATELPITSEEIVRAARAADDKEDPICVDLYASAALRCWKTLSETNSPAQQERAWTDYHQSVERLVFTGWKFLRIHPQTGLEVRLANGETGSISIARFGFPWADQDFNEFILSSSVESQQLPRYWRRSGLGVPLIVLRRRPETQGFLGPVTPFAATAILRPASETRKESTADSVDRPTIGRLELYDPLNVSTVACGPVSFPLTRDISAPLALAKQHVKRHNWIDFMKPGREDPNHGLRMVQPYQPGKIPVLFVHGLLSDKFTWIPLVNDMRAVPWINERYQLWTFQYPTGQSLLRSGAELRQALRDLAATLDPQSADPAMKQMVIVGHSMGGLVANLQITSSGTVLWDKFANRPFSEIKATPSDLEQLEALFFFEPSHMIRRVVAMGTPHRGSAWAENFVGRLGERLVRPPPDRLEMLAALLKNNPNVFNVELDHNLPRSIEYLKHDNPILIGMQRLPIRSETVIHTIIGTGKNLPDGSAGDGVVPVTSARHPAAISEKLVVAKHSELLTHPEAIQEVIELLGQHLREVDEERWPSSRR